MTPGRAFLLAVVVGVLLFLAGLPGDELAGLVQAYREGVIG